MRYIDEAWLREQRRFSERAFGPGDRTAGILDHFLKELEEVRENPSDIYEWVDLMLLALDGAWRNGHSPERIICALREKLEVCKRRTYPDWRTAEPGKAIEHVRSPG